MLIIQHWAPILLTLLNSTPSNDHASITLSHEQDDACALEVNAREPKIKEAEDGLPGLCSFCKASHEQAYTCKKCGTTAYCSLECYRSDRHRHKFFCRLGRAIDVTDYLVLACHVNEFPSEQDVLVEYGFVYFASGHDRQRLFELYRRLVVDWNIDEDELRSAVVHNRLKEMLVYRCLQTKDPHMLRYMQWLKNEVGFCAKDKGPGVIAIITTAQWEFLSPDEMKIPLVGLQPLEKQQALIFYAQIRNGFMPGVDEDNWISLGFCTAANSGSEQQLASAYGSLVFRCSFDEFWNAMADSNMVKLFKKYGLADQISQMRNFKEFMALGKKMHQSVWHLKRFTRMDVADPSRAVVVDYGFMNCRDAHQRTQLREIYHEYF